MFGITKQINNILRTGWEEEIFNKVKPLSSLIKELKENPKNITIHCIRHYDLDGIGVELVMRKLAKAIGCEVICYEESVKADDSFENILKNMTPYDYIFIGDLSFSNKNFVEDKIFRHISLHKKLIVLDHHQSALWMNEYDFAFIKPHDCKNCIISSGTILAFLAFKELLYGNLNRNEYSVLEKICNCIAAYDTYFFKEQMELSESQYGSYPNDLNILFKYYNSIGKSQEFLQNLFDLDWAHVDNIHERNVICAGLWLNFSDKDRAIIEIQKNNIQSEIDKALRDMKVINIHSKSVEYDSVYDGQLLCGAYYYSGPYVSEIGNAMCDNKEIKIDFAVIIDMNHNKVSLRCKNDDIDLTRLIKDIPNAGGHPKACGFDFDKSITDNNALKILSMLK